MKQIWHSKTYIRFLLSFCLILICLAVPFTALLRTFIRTSAENDLRLASQASVEQSSMYVDQLLNSMNTIALAIPSSSIASNFRIESNSTTRLEMIKSLRQYRTFSNLVANIFYIPANGKYMLSSTSSYTDETFDRLYRREHLDSGRLREILQTKSSPLLFAQTDTIHNTVQNEITPQDMLTIVYPLPYGAIGKYALLLFDIDAQRLQDMLQLNTLDGFPFLMDERNRILSGGQQLALTEAQLAEIREVEGFGEIMLDQTRYYLSTVSLTYGWQLFHLIPASVLAQTVYQQQAQFLVVFFAVIAVGFLLALALSMWNYRPIAVLRGKLAADESLPPYRDELEAIEHSVSTIITENNSLTARLVDNRQAILSHHVLSLINNRFTQADDARLREDGLVLRHANYVIALFAPRNPTIIHKEGGWIAQLLAVMPARWDAYLVEYQPSRLYIGLLSLPAMTPQALRDQMEDIRQASPSPVAIGISAQTGELYNLAPTFIQAQVALQQRFFYGYHHVYSDEDAVRDANRSFDYPHAQLHALDLALNSRDEATCLQALGELFATIRKSSLTLETVYCICFDILNQIIRRLIRHNLKLEHVERILPDIIQVTRNETLEELQELMTDALETSLYALHEVDDATPSAMPSLQEMFDYIEQNGYSSDFTVQMLTEHFGISYPYLGRHFKSMTGKTLNKHVQECRITLARKLLVSTELTLTEIVEQVGYIDLSSFIKLFKQSTGMTPIAYRRLYQRDAP